MAIMNNMQINKKASSSKTQKRTAGLRTALNFTKFFSMHAMRHICLVLLVAIVFAPSMVQAATVVFHPSGSASGNNVFYSGGSAATALDTNDGNTSYGQSNGSTNDYYLAIDDRTTETGTINSVTVFALVYRDSGFGGIDFRIGVRTNGSEYFSSSQYHSTSTYTTYSGNTYATNPQTGAAWTWAEIDSVVGIVDHTDTTDMRVTELYIEVDYTSGSTVFHPSGSAAGDNVFYSGGSAATALDTNDGNFSYGQSNSSANDYYLAIDDHTTETGTINSVTVNAVVSNTGFGGIDFRIGVRTNGFEYFMPPTRKRARPGHGPRSTPLWRLSITPTSPTCGLPSFT